MSELPGELKYTQSHEWVRIEDETHVVIGITDHAQHSLGELVYVELPEAGREVEAGEPVAVVESVKAASDVYAPVSGEVVAATDALEDAPELVNSQPYEDGWLLRMRVESVTALGDLMDAAAYAETLEE
ncbi:MAG: glycine cleavage system protein GcvH [Pseudomonadota bacterium]